MKSKYVLLLVISVLSVMFMFRSSMYTEGDCTPDSEEYLRGKRCFDAEGHVKLTGPFCKEKCTGTWK